jgi:hypothetical protein
VSEPAATSACVLAEAVAHDHVGMHPVLAEQSHQRGVCGENGGLGDLGLQQLLSEPGLFGRVGVVTEDELRQRATEQRRHDGVGFVERLGYHRLRLAKVLEHVDVLRALTGE